MSVATIININNDLKNSFDIKEYQYQRQIFKEIFLNKNDLTNEMNKVNGIIYWIKKEIIKGHSIYINVLNYEFNFLENDSQENNWIFIIGCYIGFCNTNSFYKSEKNSSNKF